MSSNFSVCVKINAMVPLYSLSIEHVDSRFMKMKF